MEKLQNQPCLVMELPLPQGTEAFELEKAVCSHGFFMMAPNYWHPLSKTFTRPLRIHHHHSSVSSVIVSISQRPSSLAITVHAIHSLSLEQQRAIKDQVSRMLRFSEQEEKAVREFRSLPIDHQSRSFAGRAFRSPTLFEDMVKCILLCNCHWPRTLSMAQALCELQFELQNRSPCTVEGSANSEIETNIFFPKTPAKEYFNHTGNFPHPSELANLDEKFIANRCKLGYRAGYIIELARTIVEGKIQLGELEELSKDASLSSYKQIEDQLKQMKGFGPFTRANILMCLGYYHVIPADSETVRHLKQVHLRNSTSQTVAKDVKEIYGKYQPYQFLAYWSEIWDFYERRFGKMNEMHSSDYKLITASNMKSADDVRSDDNRSARNMRSASKDTRKRKRKRPSRKGHC